jgi:Lipase (class 3)
MTPPPFGFTSLTESSTNTTMTLPADFDPMSAWLLAQCCGLTYLQYDTATPPALSTLTLTGATITPGTPQVLTVSEANGPESSPDYPGSYTNMSVGFAVSISQSGAKGSLPSQFIVVALRGTQTWDEWMGDAEAYPAFYGSTIGLVHGGIYGLYTDGTDGATVQNPLSPTAANRATGSIAAQIATILTNGSLPANLPIYVTGHSLGGALAALCALDIALNFSSAVQSVSVYTLASPRVVMGLQFPGDFSVLSAPTGNFLNQYQTAVPKSFQIVHACDIIPILPPTTVISNSLLTINAAQITDGYTYLGKTYPGLPNVISFCAQTGDIGNNHGCAISYLPYAAWLAAAWLAAQNA